jgi:predicted signal transduction protein with EAL and GGDEF domain
MDTMGAVFCLCFGAIYALWLLFTLANSRAQQTRLYSELDRVARLDGLTDVYNRRQLDEDLTRELGQAFDTDGRSRSFSSISTISNRPMTGMDTKPAT